MLTPKPPTVAAENIRPGGAGCGWSGRDAGVGGGGESGRDDGDAAREYLGGVAGDRRRNLDPDHIWPPDVAGDRGRDLAGGSGLGRIPAGACRVDCGRGHAGSARRRVAVAGRSPGVAGRPGRCGRLLRGGARGTVGKRERGCGRGDFAGGRGGVCPATVGHLVDGRCLRRARAVAGFAGGTRVGPDGAERDRGGRGQGGAPTAGGRGGELAGV